MNNAVVYLPKNVRQKIKMHARFAYPRECCGVLFGILEDGGYCVVDAVPAYNLVSGSDSQKDARSFYRMDPLEVYGLEKAWEQKGMELIGTYHSHPDRPAILSGADEDGMIPEQIYIVMSETGKQGDEIRAWKKSLSTMDVLELSMLSKRKGRTAAQV